MSIIPQVEFLDGFIVQQKELTGANQKFNKAKN